MLKPTIRAQRALDRAAARGRSRVSLPVDVLDELLAQAVEGDALNVAIQKVAANIGRQHPEFIPTE